MQGSIPAARVSTRLTTLSTGLVVAVAAMTGVSFFSFWKIDGVRANLETTNRFYVPTLKHVNILLGKLSAYQRAFEQNAGVKFWGKSDFTKLSVPKLPLKKMIEPHISEIDRRRAGDPRLTNALLDETLSSLESWAARESEVLTEIRYLAMNKKYTEAAPIYTAAKQEQQRIMQGFQDSAREIEERMANLQTETEAELSRYQGMLLMVLVAIAAFSLVLLFRVRRWMAPITEWIKVASEIAIHGIHRGIEFPKVTKSMPPEIAVLTSEFRRMGMTVLEREKTLDSLNSHLKEQNNTLRTLGGLNEKILNNMSSGLLLVGADGRVAQFNKSFQKLLGMERFAEVSKLSESASGVVLKDGRVFDVQIQDFEDGKLYFFDETTEIVAASEKLEHLKKLVLAGNMSSQVAHELRNPLNAMSLQLDLLEEDVADLDQGTASGARSIEITKRIRTINEQVQRLDRMTRKYLDFGRSVTQRKSNLNLHQLIESCIAFYRVEIQASHIAVDLDLNASECNVSGDKDALSQVFSNLIKNSLEAGAKRIRIATASSDGKVSVTFADNGSGIPENVRAKLFEPFVTSKANGHGLGLSISRQICIEHEGELVHQESDDGAVFDLVLPVEAFKALERTV